MSSSYTKEFVLDLINRSDLALARAILALYSRQTADEQAVQGTHVANGRGFNQNDAEFLTSIAQALPRWNNHMTPKQIAGRGRWSANIGASWSRSPRSAPARPVAAGSCGDRPRGAARSGASVAEGVRLALDSNFSYRDPVSKGET